MIYLTVAVTAFVLSCAITPLVRLMNIVDVPNERSSHDTPTPRSGGIAIILGMFGAALAFGVIDDRPHVLVAAGVILVAIAGLIDDIRSHGPLPRFLTHCAAAVIAVFFAKLVIARVEWPWSDSTSGELALAMFAIPITFLFIVGLTNAYNFMDGINGIASLEAIVAAGTLALLFLQVGDSSAALLAIALAAACAGFLPWNFPRAAIFMGDVGSGAIGFLLAALVVRYTTRGGSLFAAILPLLPFILDTAVTFVRRSLRGEKVYAAHRSHFYQRLNILGWSHTAVTLLWSAVAAVGGGVAVLYVRMTPMERTIAVAIVLLLHVAIAIAITRREASRQGQAPGYRRSDDRRSD